MPLRMISCVISLVCDELDSLGTVAGIADANTRGRKYGLCSVGAIQSKAQLDATYGPLGAQTLLSTFSSKITFRQGSWSDAEYWSNEFGQREITEQVVTRAESSNSGSSSGGGGFGGSSSSGNSTTKTTAQTRKIVQTVLPSELAELPDRTAYCRFPGMEGIHKIEFDIRKYKPIRPAFLAPGEPETEFEDPKVEVVKKPEGPEEPVRVLWSSGIGPFLVRLLLVGFIILPFYWFWKTQLASAPTAPPLPAIIAPAKPVDRVFHWTHGTFRCRVDHSVGGRPWACVRIGPPRHPESRLVNPPPMVRKATPVQAPSHPNYTKGSSEDPTLAVWSGPLPGNVMAWCHEFPQQKWIAFWKPDSGNVRVRALCPKGMK